MDQTIRHVSSLANTVVLIRSLSMVQFELSLNSSHIFEMLELEKFVQIIVMIVRVTLSARLTSEFGRSSTI